MSDKTVQLIEVVKKYPALYDPSHENYKNNKIKNKVWDCVAEQVQEKDGDVVKAKWKNLRDSYGKHLRSHDPQTASKLIERYKTWPWVKQMTFLQPFLEYSVAQSNMTVPSREFENYTDQLGKTLQKTGASCQKFGTTLQHVAVQYQDIPAQEQCFSSQHIQHNERRPRETQFDDVINYYNNMTEYDETDLIFLGYSKTIKKMSLRRQALVKFNIAKIIMEAEIDHVEETSLHNNVNRPASPSFNSSTDRNKSPQESYNFPSNYTQESDFPDPAESKVELQEFCRISSGLDPLSLASHQNLPQRNYHSHQKSILPSTVTEDAHVTCSQLHSSFDNKHENKIVSPSGKKVKLQYKELEKKS